MDLLLLVLTQPFVMLCLIDVCVPNAYPDFTLQTVSHVSNRAFKQNSQLNTTRKYMFTFTHLSYIHIYPQAQTQMSYLLPSSAEWHVQQCIYFSVYCIFSSVQALPQTLEMQKT